MIHRYDNNINYDMILEYKEIARSAKIFDVERKLSKIVYYHGFYILALEMAKKPYL